MDEIDQLLAQLNDPSKGQSIPPPSPPLRANPSSTDASIEGLLDQVKSEYDGRDRLAAEEQAQQQALLEQQQREQAQAKQQRLEALKAQRRVELRSRAQEWLTQLKPKSTEGQWFAEFACNYETPLEAAIDYLEALESVNRGSPNG